MENNNDILKEKFKFRVSISKIKAEGKEHVEKTNNFSGRKIAIAACACLVFTTGIVFAKDIENFIKVSFGLGKGVETAIENGYISNSDEQIEFINSEVVVTKGDSESEKDTLNAGIRINNFVMTDSALSLNIEMKFDEKINRYKDFGKKINENIDYENFGHIELTDLFILDEENRLIYAPINEENFKEFCAENNLELEYLEFNENYLNSVTNCNIQEINPDTNTIRLTYIIQTSDEMPKSKQLKLYWNKIAFVSEKDENNKSNDVYLSGNWNIKLEIPEIMYNRSDNSYNVISCENKDFNVYTAKVTETGFEIGIKISNIEMPSPNKELIDSATGMPYIFNSREELLGVNSDKEFEKMYIEYNNKCWPVRVNGSPVASWLDYTEGCYIENDKGEKFKCSNSPARKQNSEFLDGNIYDFYETFDMTKFDATDKITAVIEVYGKPYKIELEKLK